MDLIQIVDAALADSARRSGPWLVCKPGCCQCCTGIFIISALDAERLRDGLAAAGDDVAGRIRERVREARTQLDSWYPGDLATGVLNGTDEAIELFEEYGADEVCPILDPTTGTCDLYAARPILCRTFGPPVRNDEDGLAICELCFDGAPEADVAAAEMDTSWREREEEDEARYEAAHEGAGRTMIAWALLPGEVEGRATATTDADALRE